MLHSVPFPRKNYSDKSRGMVKGRSRQSAISRQQSVSGERQAEKFYLATLPLTQGLCLCLAAFCLSFIAACSSGHSATREGVAPVPTKPWEEVAAEGADNGGYGLPQQAGTITDKALREVSGITAGRINPQVWWVENDSGNPANVYALDQSGKLLATFVVTGAQNQDWEDIASGPGRDGKPALYLGDIGDNERVRDEVIIYRVPEPKLRNGVMTDRTEPAESFRFRYPDGRHDAEALFVDPQSGRVYLVTKTRQGGCGIYRAPAPLKAGALVTLEKMQGSAVDEIAKLPLVTGADAAPDGSRVVIRTYFSAVELRRASNAPFESVFNSKLFTVNVPLERQGEAIAYSADSRAIVTTSERVPAPLYRIERQ